MLRLKKILVPTDFSSGSRLAYAYGGSFSAEFGSFIHVVHVIEGRIGDAGTLDDTLGIDNRDVIFADARRKLDEFCGSIGAELDAVKCVVSAEAASEAICKYAAENKVSLIIMGAGGTKGFIPAWLGSTSYHVVKKAPCPVLTVKPDEEHFINA
jgi:universal stress protein A